MIPGKNPLPAALSEPDDPYIQFMPIQMSNNSSVKSESPNSSEQGSLNGDEPIYSEPYMHAMNILTVSPHPGN